MESCWKAWGSVLGYFAVSDAMGFLVSLASRANHSTVNAGTVIAGKLCVVSTITLKRGTALTTNFQYDEHNRFPIP
jgi:hypothetical protein